MALGDQSHASAALLPGKRPGTYCTGGWVDPSAGLDVCGTSRPHRDLIPLAVQLVVSRYTDYTFQVQTLYVYKGII
jgi:hypothetical protein